MGCTTFPRCKKHDGESIKTNFKKIKINQNKFLKTGIVQYFYHYPESKLPIRDFARKTEPHIEIGAENYLRPCYQPNIKKFAAGKEEKWKGRYLFLITTCKHKELNKKFGNKTNQFIVGYIVKDEAYEINGRVFVKGCTCIYSFQDSILTKELFGKNFDRSGNNGKTISLMRNPFVDEEKTEDILRHFKNKGNILKKCILEMIFLENSIDKECLKDKCIFKHECLRRKLNESDAT